MSDTIYECPYCHSDHIQSYNIAYASGISDVQGTTTGVGVGLRGGLGVGIGRTVGTQQTALSTLAQPPVKKSVVKYFIKWSFLLWIGMVFAVVIIGSSHEIWPMIWMLLALASIMYNTYKRYTWNRDSYPKLREEWEHTYVCLRCGNSFQL